MEHENTNNLKLKDSNHSTLNENLDKKKVNQIDLPTKYDIDNISNNDNSLYDNDDKENNVNNLNKINFNLNTRFKKLSNYFYSNYQQSHSHSPSVSSTSSPTISSSVSSPTLPSTSPTVAHQPNIEQLSLIERDKSKFEANLILLVDELNSKLINQDKVIEDLKLSNKTLEDDLKITNKNLFKIQNDLKSLSVLSLKRIQNLESSVNVNENKK